MALVGIIFTRPATGSRDVNKPVRYPRKTPSDAINVCHCIVIRRRVRRLPCEVDGSSGRYLRVFFRPLEAHRSAAHSRSERRVFI